LQTLIFANGEFNPPQDFDKLLAEADLIIATDGGAQHCQKLGLRPHILIGDFDSIPVTTRRDLESQGVRVFAYPVVKDQTDLELAFLRAQQEGAKELTVLAGLGRRWDHSLANLLLGGHPKFAELRVRFLHGEQRLYILRGKNKLAAQPGERVSLLPLSGDVIGVSSRRLAYPLDNETLHFGSSRGVSNIVLAVDAEVNLHSGVLLCVISPSEDK